MLVMTRRTVLLVSLLLALAGAGCGASPPQAFEDREELTDCGLVTLDDTPPSPAELEAEQCLRTAVANQTTVEMRLVSFTVEGDEIKRYVRSVSGGLGPVEIFTDATSDNGGKWYHSRCRGLDDRDPTGIGCQPVEG